VPYTPLLVDTGSHRVLIDTGAGPLAASCGHLESSLSRSGFQASDIDVVLLSHAHPDHIGGLVRDDGTLRFPTARVLISQKEYDFWHSADLRSRLGTGSVYGSPELENLMGGWIDRYLPPVRDRLEWLVDESEIAPGIQKKSDFSRKWRTLGGLKPLTRTGHATQGIYTFARQIARRGFLVFAFRTPASSEIASLQEVRRTGVFGWPWVGLTPDGNPLILRDTGTEEIYALDVDLP
jgi:ribonuclease BN (tRNA processing enzyme)